MPHNVEYVPPSSEVIEHFAHRVYWELELDNRDNEREFAGFLKVVSRAVAKELSRKSSSDLTPDIQ